MYLDCLSLEIGDLQSIVAVIDNRSWRRRGLVPKLVVGQGWAERFLSGFVTAGSVGLLGLALTSELWGPLEYKQVHRPPTSVKAPQ